MNKGISGYVTAKPKIVTKTDRFFNEIFSKSKTSYEKITIQMLSQQMWLIDSNIF